MPGNQIQLTLQVNADTQQAKRELNSLKAQLDKIAATKTSKIIDSEGMVNNLGRASVAAKELRTMLQQATDVNTGQLNLSKFALSLKNSGKNIQDLEAQLRTLGPEGARAAQQLSSSITNAQAPVLQLNGVAEKLLTTFKNTGRYLLSTAIFRAVSSGAREAIQYIQDLNKSLTDIRIVTGYSIDQMAQFASQANNAAKALSTTTNEYTKASLIFFQQGLTGDAVQERTDTTIKMANVTGQSAQQVSDQMTAVWNNFAKGGENLESYADKMVALGAATASSSTEIATGLEKFAAIADTVGLSFDYASAALATVTATTRQSADTVGTAFKTLFARLESLKLGETLDDGTDLTKYSQALLAVGVNVKDANGELKDMDTIIDETMSKWQTLSKDQQVALAQTVAGMRQYTQFIALMDSADFFKENLATARGAEGTLQEQADIYAESWEAAKKRVTAAAEGIYDSLLDDQFFIKMTNGFGKFLEVIDNVISGLGGLKTLLPGIISLVFTLFNQKISTSLLAGFNTLTGAGRRAAEELRADQNARMAEKFESEKNSLGQGLMLLNDKTDSEQSAQQEVLNTALEKEKNLRQQIADTYHLMSPEQQKMVDGNLQLIQNAKDELQIEEEKLKVLQEEQAAAAQKKDEVLQRQGGNSDLYNFLNQNKQQITWTGQKVDTSHAFQTNAIKQYQQALQEAGTNINKVKTADSQLIKNLEKEQTQWQQVSTTIKNNVQQLGLADGAINRNSSAYTELYNQFDKLGLSGKDLDRVLDEIAKAFLDAKDAEDAFARQAVIVEGALDRVAQTTDESKKNFGRMHMEQQTAAQAFTSLTSGVTSAFAALNSLKNLGNIWSDETLSGGEKLFQSLSSIAFAVPMVMNSIRSFSSGGEKLAGFLNTVNLAGKETGKNIGIFSRLAGSLSKTQAAADAAANATGGMSKGMAVASKGAISLGGALGAVAIYAAIAVAAIAAVAAVAYIIYQEATREERNAKAMDDALDRQKEHANRLKNEYEELKSQLNEVTEAQERFANAKTPEEAKEILEEMNEKAKQLIEKYNLLFGKDWKFDENGAIVFEDETTENIENDEKQRYQQAVSIAANTQAVRDKARNDVTALNIADRLDYSLSTWTDKDGNGYRTIKNDDGTFGTEKANFLVGGLNEEESIDIVNSITNLFKDYKESHGGIGPNEDAISDLLKNSGLFSDELLTVLIPTVQRASGQIDAYSDTLIEQNKKLTSQTRDAIASTVYDKFGEQAEKFGAQSSGIIQALTTLYASQQADVLQKQNEKIESAIQDARGWGQFSNDNLVEFLKTDVAGKTGEKALIDYDENANGALNDEEMAKMYMNYILGEGYTYVKNGKGESIFKDANGDEVTKTDTEMREDLALHIGQLEALSNLDIDDEIATKLMSTIKKANEIGGKVGEEFANAIIEAAANGEEINFDGIIETLDDETISKLKGMNGSQLANYFGFSDEDFKQMGFNGAEQFSQAFKKRLEDADDIKLEANINLLPTLQEAFESAQSLDLNKAYKKDDLSFITDAGLNIEDYFAFNPMKNKWEATVDALTLPYDIQQKIIDTNNAALEKIHNDFQEKADSLSSSTPRNGDTGKEKYQALANDRDYFDDYFVNNRQIEQNAAYTPIGNGQSVNSETGEMVNTENLDRQNAILSANNDILKELAVSQHEYMQGIADSATSIQDLDVMLQQGLITTKEYDQAADRLGETEKLAGLKMEDVAEIAKGMAAAWNEENKEAIAAGKTARKTARDFTTQAAESLQAEKAIKNLKNEFSNYSDVIKKGLNDSSKRGNDFTRAMSEMKSGMAALLGIAADEVPEGLLNAENLDLLEKALNNDSEAAAQFQENFEKLAMTNMEDKIGQLTNQGMIDNIASAFSNMGIATNSSIESIIGNLDTFKQRLSEIDWSNMDSLDTTNAIAALQALIDAGVMTKDEIENALQLEVDTEYEEDEIEQNHTSPPKFVESYTYKNEPITFKAFAPTDNNPTGTVDVTEYRPRITKNVEQLPGESGTSETTVGGFQTSVNGKKQGTGREIIKKVSKRDTVGQRIAAAGGGKGTGSSGGGGGGGGSAKKPKLKEADAKSRYHRVDKQLEKSKDEYDQIGKARERAYGPKVLQYMQQELELLRQQKELTHQKRLEAEAYLKEDLAALNGYAAEANFTVTYDESGIVNYEDLKKKADEYYNANVTGDSDADEWLEKWYDHFTKMLDQYEETLKVIRDQTNEEFEFERQMLDNQLEQIQWNVDLKLEINESVKKYWDYMDSRLESLVEEAEKLNYLISKVDAIKKISSANMDVATQGLIDQFGVIGVDSSLVELLSKQIRGELPEGQSDWSETYLQLVKAIQDAGDENNVLMEKLKEYIDIMVENVQAQADVHKEALDQEEELFNTALEDLDKKFEKFGKIVEEIGMYGDVVDALGKRASGAVRETLAAIRNARINATSEQINALGSEITKREPELQNLQKEYDEKKAKYNSSSISQAEKDSLGRDINKLKSQIDTLSDYLDSKKSDWQSAIVDLAGQVKENFSAAINDIIDDFDYAISDMYASVEELQKAYDQRRTLEEQYIPEYKQVYELNKISRDLSKQLDTTDSLAAQKKLRDFQKEIYDLQNSGKKLSEYDLEYLQKKYDLRVAEIALEDAQNAKNQVRLSRDAEGNYSYVYTADEENTDQAVQDYEDKMYALQELSENRLKDVGSDYLAAVKEMEDSLRELADQDLTESQKNVAVAEIEKMFKERVAFLSLQNKQILKNNEDLYKNDYANYSKMTKNISAQTEAFMMRDKDFTTGFSDTILGSVLGSYESLDDHASSTLALLEAEQGGVLSKIDAAYDEFEAQMTETYSKLGLAWNNHMEDLKGDQRLVEFLRGNVTEYETYKTRASEELEQVGDKASHEAGRIISHFSGKENSGHDAAWYLDAMATSGANAARIFQTDFNSAASTLLSNLNDGKGNGIEPKLLGSADSAKIFADNAKKASENVDTAKGSVSNFTTEMINALTKAEGEEGYLAKLKSAFSSNLTGTDHESVESITVNAGEYVSTKFVNPSEQAITGFDEWMTKTGIPGFSATMGQYTAVADPEKIKQNMEGAEDPFEELPDKVHQYLPDWEAEINKWAGKVTDIGGAAGSTSTKIGETFSGIPNKIKMPSGVTDDINNWTTTLSLLGGAFTKIYNTSSDAATGIGEYNKESPKNYSASTTIASNVADVIDKIIIYNGTEPTNWDTSVNVSWKDDFENFIKKDSNFNKNLDAINQKTGTVQVNYKDTWTDEFNTQIQKHMSDLTDKVIKIKYEIDDSALVNDNNANNMASAGQLATLMLRHSARLNDMISNGNDTGNGATIGGIYNDQSFSARDARLFLQYASFGESALKGLEDWQKNRFFQFLQEYIAGDLQFRENGKIIGYASSFSSGGYTGDWGDSGKLAMLHQKELVLNQADTSNILAAVDLVRQAAQAIDLSARASQYAMGSNLAAATTASIVNSSDLNQNVTIYAEFPGVSVEAEIQNAFNAMEMQAIQYAHRDY